MAMGRQNNDHTLLYSSIALLQERFKQLQRAKEMREERELLRVFAEAEFHSTNPRQEHPKWFFHPELIRPPPMPLHGLPTYHHASHADCKEPHISLSIALRPSRATMHAYANVNETDVDTTLHL